MTEYKEDELAYDGSSNPQRRELTPRERDIICRVITDILGFARRSTSFADFDCVPIRIGELDFFSIIKEVRRVLDPRED